MTKTSIHDVTEVTTKQASSGNVRWTEVIIKTNEGTHEIVLFPAGDLPAPCLTTSNNEENLA